MKLNIIPPSVCQTIFLLFVSLLNTLYAQQKFDVSLLQDSEKNGAQISALLSTSEVYEYEKKKQNCIYLQNGLRASSFINETEWNAIKDTVEVIRIDIVYSKYPLRSGVYHEIYPLLFDRLKALFQMDSELNDASIEFNKILQTHCENDAQVRSLFHGIVIHYSTIEIVESEVKIADTKTDRINNTLSQQDAEQSTIQDMETAVNRILELPGMPDSLKTIISKQPLDLQMKSIMTYLKEDIENEPDYDLSKLSPEKIDTFKRELNFFSSCYKSGDSVVHAVFNRHPEWKNILVINDWTGSMYGYGAQVLDWHLKNFEKSGILSLTLFNDGDMRPHHEKKVGETGGIYMEPADNVPQLVDLFNYVMLQGGGGDAPENDIEAILKSIETYERFSEIVLIADNNACIRDISLADRIGVPVRIVVCGYNEKRGVNPHLVYLAKITNGGIYTIEDDLENIDTDLAEGGMLKSFKDKRFKLIKNACEDIELLSGQKIYKLKEGLRKKKKVIHLDASEEKLTKVPGGVFKMSRLKTLDLSKNELGSLSPKIGSLGYLQSLNLSTNQLKDLPLELIFIRYLEQLDLSSNQFDSIPTALYSQKLLKNLNISHNQLTYFDVSTLKSLQTLNLSNNQLTTLSKSVGKLKSLNFLDLSSNAIEKFPISIYNLRKLKELDLSLNAIKEFPSDLRRLQHIKVLRLNGNQLSEDEKNRIRSGLKFTQIIF